MAELRSRYRGCPTGSAVITGSGRLAEHGVRWVVHAVGPVWRGGGLGEEQLLRSAYGRSLDLANQAGARVGRLPRDQRRRLRLPSRSGRLGRAASGPRRPRPGTHGRTRDLRPVRPATPWGIRAGARRIWRPDDLRSPAARRASRYPPHVSEIAFPAGFMWGTATAAHQVEGGNTNSDWWAFELQAGHAVQGAQRHRHRPLQALPARHRPARRPRLQHLPVLGRVGPHRAERGRLRPGPAGPLPQDGRRCAARASSSPMVTLNHFTLPKWVAEQRRLAVADATPVCSSATSGASSRRSATRSTGTARSTSPAWSPSAATCGALAFPPGPRGLANWKRRRPRSDRGPRRARAAIKELRPSAKVGLTNVDAGMGVERRRRAGHEVRPPAMTEDVYPRGGRRRRLHRRPDLHPRAARAARGRRLARAAGPGGPPAREADRRTR